MGEFNGKIYVEDNLIVIGVEKKWLTLSPEEANKFTLGMLGELSKLDGEEKLLVSYPAAESEQIQAILVGAFRSKGYVIEVKDALSIRIASMRGEKEKNPRLPIDALDGEES